jgi:hypothetical protein
MGTKNNPGQFDCYDNALPDEPMFTLLGRDPDAPDVVRKWADNREQLVKLYLRPASDMEQVQEARECADEMERWRRSNCLVWRKPKA